MSTFGSIFRVTTFGESHCKGVGCIIDNFPPGIPLTEDDIQPQLTRRRPGQSKLTTPRDEADVVTILSGTEHGRTLGTPIALFVANKNTRPKDYGEMSAIPRPGHADYTYQVKYGIRAASGGGRSSARETIGRVASGAVAEVFLREAFGTQISCWVTAVGDVEVPPEAVHKPGAAPWTRDDIDNLSRFQLLRDPARWRVSASEGRAGEEDQKAIDNTYDAWLLEASGWLRGEAAQDIPAYLHMPVADAAVETCSVFTCDGRELRDVDPALVRAWASGDLVQVRCPHPPSAARMATKIRHMKLEEDSTGGILTCVIHNVPVGLGEPCFDKLEAKLAHAMLSLPATKGFEIGSGFAGTRLRGSAHNDVFVPAPGTSGAPDEGEGPSSAKRRRTPGSVAGEVSAFDTALMRTRTNNAGGTLGGVSTGEDIVFRVAIKPVSTIGRAQATATYGGKPATLEARGRHDPCVLPRAGPLVEGMAALVIMDAVLLQRSRRPDTLRTLAQAVDSERAQE